MQNPETNQNHAEELVRLQKLQSLNADGIPGFPQTTQRSHNIGEILQNFADLRATDVTVTVVGRLLTIRAHGGSTFVDLRDVTGKIQLHFRRDVVGEAAYNLFKEKIDHGDFIQASGNVVITKVGEKTIEVTDFRLLTKTLLPLPDKFHGLADVELRYRKRYLDLLANEEAWRIACLRPQIVQAIRDFLNTRGFIEVETPVLQDQAGGALAQPFLTHHNALNVDLYLRIAPELYLKRLLVGGFEKVFEIARCFRNEGIDRAHNPEFTQVEFYWAYADYEDLMRLSEELISQLVARVHGSFLLPYRGEEFDFTPPFPRLTLRAAILQQLGVDIDNLRDENSLRAYIEEQNFSDVNLINCVGYAEILDELYKRTVRPNLRGPVFLIDYPVEMVPLAKRCEYDSSKAAVVQLVFGGVELFKGYNELNDPLEQEQRFREQQSLAEQGSAEAMRIDYDYLMALKHGMPPAAGWGMGIDRLLQVLTDAPNLKEVILFPTLRPNYADNNNSQ